MKRRKVLHVYEGKNSNVLEIIRSDFLVRYLMFEKLFKKIYQFFTMQLAKIKIRFISNLFIYFLFFQEKYNTNCITKNYKMA